MTLPLVNERDNTTNSNEGDNTTSRNEDIVDLPCGVAPIKSEYIKPKVDNMTENSVEKKSGGTFKKRPRDEKANFCDQLCRLIASGEGCPYSSDKCKYSHDIADFMKRREKDIGDICPNFASGYCRFGLNCRYASCHLDKENNNIKLDTYDPMKRLNKNILTTQLRNQLRKKSYPIKSKYQMRKGKKVNLSTVEDKENTNIEIECTESPLLKERKLIDFRKKIYIAPLTTVGNLPFRCIMKKFGADITCGEMAMSQNILEGHASEWALLRRHPSEDIFGVQIAGAHEDQIGRCTELLTSETDIDFIDINMGCPIDLVCNSGAGSALMTRLNKLEGVIRGAMTGIQYGNNKDSTIIPELTIKMRTGWDHKKPNAHTLVPLIQEWGNKYGGINQHISAITIHGRSRLMRYSKLADWDYIKQAANNRIKDINNKQMYAIGGGDILSFEEWENHLEDGSLDSCMLARGALIKPWLPTEIKERRHWDISASERLDILKDFVSFGLQHWGSDQEGVNKTRRFLLEWLSFLCRYIPVGLLERLPQKMNERPYPYYGRNDLETLMASTSAESWVQISEILLGKVPDGFQFQPKHKANAY